jgi:phosphoglycerate dehydrogenase-like enzyme
MRRKKLVLFSARGRASLPEALARRLEAVASVDYRTTPGLLSDADLVEQCAQAEVVGLTRLACKDFHADLVDRLPRLRGLAVYATGDEWLDRPALARRQVDVRVLPDYSAQSVAEHALAMLLGLSRRLHLSDRVARGELPDSISLRGWELAGKKLGIVGLGRIGRRIAQLASAFGMDIHYCDPAVPAAEGWRAMALGELLAGCPVVMLAASVERGAPPLISGAQLQAMPAGGYLVNPSRPQLVDHDAVRAAIASGHLAGYAVDERVFCAAQLAGLEAGRILQTGHTAWYSNEAMARGAEAWVNHLVELAQA